MHRPPAVSHTLGRSSWQLCLVALLAAVALVAAAMLAFSNTLPIFRWTVPLVTVCCTVVALIGWARSACGILQWDGQHWLWSGFADVPVRRTRSVLDFQGLMLLKVTSEVGDVAWLWLQGRMNDAHWLAVRRAVVASQALQVEQATRVNDAGAGGAP